MSDLTARDDATARLRAAIERTRACLARGNVAGAADAASAAEQALRDLEREIAAFEQRMLGIVFDAARDAGRLTAAPAAAAKPARTRKRKTDGTDS